MKVECVLALEPHAAVDVSDQCSVKHKAVISDVNIRRRGFLLPHIEQPVRARVK